jgi:hypothetical protein
MLDPRPVHRPEDVVDVLDEADGLVDCAIALLIRRREACSEFSARRVFLPTFNYLQFEHTN